MTENLDTVKILCKWNWAKLSELHDWHMFLAAGQLGLNVNAWLLWMSYPIVQPTSDMTGVTWHDNYVHCGKKKV